MASLLVSGIGIQWSRWYLAHPKVFTVAAVIHVSGDFRLYRDDFRSKISHLGYCEPMMITLLTNFLKPLPLLARSQLASVPGLWLYRKRPRV